MKFTFTDEQRLLRDSARDFLASRYPIERVAEISDGAGWDARWWPEIAELGWTGISVPDDAGGAGMSFLEEMVVLEEMGRNLFPGPFLSTVILALPALAPAPDLVEAVVGGKVAATLAWAEEDGAFLADGLWTEATEEAGTWRLSGRKLFVPDIAPADLLVAVARGPEGVGLWAVDRDAAGLSWEEVPTIDFTRRVGMVTFQGAEGRLLEQGPEAERTLARIRDRGLAALAAEAVGVATRALELSVAHARTREQFGRPIGIYQAVSHKLADAFVEIESARSLAYWAAWAVANETEDAPAAAAGAKAYASEAAVRTCERAIQVHGGIGFTWEHPLHRFYRRAQWIAAFLGSPSALRARVARVLLDEAGPGSAVES